MNKIFTKLNFNLLLLALILFSAKGSTAQSLFICDIDAIDQEGNDYTFSLTKTAPGVSIDLNSGIIVGDETMTVGTHIIGTRVTDEYGAISDAYSFAFIVDSYCGDNIIQIPNSEGRGGPLDDGFEECDGNTGIAFTPVDSGPNRMYACTDSCPETVTNCLGTCNFANGAEGGGYCGDGFVQNGQNYSAVTSDGLVHYLDYGESCDPGEEIDEYIKRTGDTTVSSNSAKWAAIRLSCDATDCTIGCANIEDIGLGCYIDDNDNGTIDNNECQKGMFVCDATNNSFACNDVFSYTIGHEVFDECCRGRDINLKNGTIDFNKVDLDWDWGGTSYNCDDICKDYGNDGVCIGVGLTNPATTACLSVIHDLGTSCQSPGNTQDDDCKTQYHHRNPTDCQDNSEAPPVGPVGFSVGEAACYCFNSN